MMPEDRQQQDDRQRHAKQPKQSTSSESHDVLLLHRRDDAGKKEKFRASQRGGMRSEHGTLDLVAAPSAGDDLDLAAAFAGKGQELFDRQRIRDPFGEPLGARSLIFEILDRVQAPPPQGPDKSPELFGQPWCVRSA